jgi:hypothetical protein
MKAIQFAELCQAYGLTGITTQWLSRTLKANKLNHDTDKALRPVVLGVEDLVERVKPFKIAFDNAEHVKLLIDVINLGVDLSVGSPISINNSSNAVSD